MSAVCLDTSSSVTLVHTIQTRGLLSDLCGMCTNICESRYSQQLTEVSEGKH